MDNTHSNPIANPTANPLANSAVGKVIYVSADHFTIELETEVGLKAEHDYRHFARIGSLLLIPINDNYLVAEVSGLKGANDENGSSAHSGRTRRMLLDVEPVGMLPKDPNGQFRFGATDYPSLQSDVLRISDTDLMRIFRIRPRKPIGDVSSLNERAGHASGMHSIAIGKSVLFEDYDVNIRLDDFFGSHAAVLGNSGSGKTCTVSAILQSLFEKTEGPCAEGATFVFLDVNGEYTQAFTGTPDLSTGAVYPSANNPDIKVAVHVLGNTAAEHGFRLPHWLLDESEWELLLQVDNIVQASVLRNALGLTCLFKGVSQRSTPTSSILKRGDDVVSLLRKNTDGKQEIREHLLATCILECFRGVDGDSPVAKYQRMSALLDKYSTPNLNRNILDKYGYSQKTGSFSFAGNESKFLDAINSFIKPDLKIPEYTNLPFDFADLEECLDFAILYEEAHGNRQVRDACARMVTRFKTLVTRSDYAFIRGDASGDEKTITVDTFVTDLLGLKKTGAGETKEKQIIIIDLNTVGDEVVSIISTILGRKVFNRLRYAEDRNQLPIHFVLEEAHRYISSKPETYFNDFADIFERIAKEGRKYGMFLLLSSQRPVELSDTVLSQCTNYIIHRIQNPDDLLHIQQMTPFISASVLRKLPSLPKQHALIFGTSVNMPLTFKVKEANPRPRSEDANIQALWFNNARFKKLPA